MQPTMVPESSLLAKVDGAMNAIEVRGNAVGPTLYYGAGAGEMPTASAVVADLMEIAREIVRGGRGRVAPLSYQPRFIEPKSFVTDAERHGRALLRLIVRDEAGTLGRIATLLGESGIAIESIVRRGQGEAGPVSIVVLTRSASEEAFQKATEGLSALPEVLETPRRIRIEEEG